MKLQDLENISESKIGERTFIATHIDKQDNMITLSDEQTCYHLELDCTEFAKYIEMSEHTTLPVVTMLCGEPFDGDEKIDYLDWKNDHVDEKKFAEAVFEYLSHHTVKTALELIERSEKELISNL